MQRRDLSVTIALCVSLVVHGVGVIALTHYEIESQNQSLHHPVFSVRQYLPQHPRADAAPLVQATPATPGAPVAIPQPTLPPLPEFDELFGEGGSKGKAMNSSPGDQPMQAPEAPQGQAALTPTPGASDNSPSQRGEFGDGGQPHRTSLAVESTPPSPPMVELPFGLPVDLNAPFGTPLAPAPPPFAPKAFQAETHVIGIPTPNADPFAIKSDVTMAASPATKPIDLASTTQPADVAMAAPTTSPVTDIATTQPIRVALNEPRPEDLPVGQLRTTTQPSLVKIPSTQPRDRTPLLAMASTADGAHLPDSFGTGAPGTTTPSRAGGDAGNPSDSESDAFSQIPNLIYRNGKIEARDGRKVKTVRPKLTEAGIQAVIAMEDPRVVLAVKIDEQGKVIGVDYVRKSGSNEVDLPTYLAAWKWEFEPSKDKDGHFRADAFVIPFIWR